MSDELEQAIRHIEDIDGYRNLHHALPILLFLVSGGLAARSFFWILDAMTWLGLGKLDAVLPASISFVLLFVVWALAFLAAMILLERSKLGNIKTLAHNRLLNLGLSADELRQLSAFVNAKRWKHDRALKDVMATLEARKP